MSQMKPKIDFKGWTRSTVWRGPAYLVERKSENPKG